MAFTETNFDLFAGVRSRIGSPPHDVVGDPDIIDALVEAQTFYGIKQANKNQNWAVGETLLTVNPGQDVYTVPAGDHGEVLKPIRVEAYDDNNPDKHGPEIRMMLLQDENLVDDYLDYPTTNDRAREERLLGSTTAYTASAILFYGQPLQARPVPHPSVSRSYRIYYQPSSLVSNTDGRNKVKGISDYRYMYIWKACEILLPRLTRFIAKLPQNEQSVWLTGMRMNAETIQKNLAQLEAEYEKFVRRIFRPDTDMRKRWRPGGHRRRRGEYR